MLLRKGVCSYESMDEWENFNETSLCEKEDFYSNLNIADSTTADRSNAKRLWKCFKRKKVR